MGFNLDKVAERHAKIAESHIRASDNTLDIHVRATRASASGASLFGDFNTPQDEPVVYANISCLWTDAPAVPTEANMATLQILAKYNKANALCTVWLEDVLVDAFDRYGDTYFDLAVSVVKDGHAYQVLASERHGLSTKPPYLLTVVLAGEKRRHG